MKSCACIFQLRFDLLLEIRPLVCEPRLEFGWWRITHKRAFGALVVGNTPPSLHIGTEDVPDLDATQLPLGATMPRQRI